MAIKMNETQNKKLILQQLENNGEVYVSKKGVIWISNQSKKLDEVIRKGTEH